jgi:hypothetical protein
MTEAFQPKTALNSWSRNKSDECGGFSCLSGNQAHRNKSLRDHWWPAIPFSNWSETDKWREIIRINSRQTSTLSPAHYAELSLQHRGGYCSYLHFTDGQIKV